MDRQTPSTGEAVRDGKGNVVYDTAQLGDAEAVADLYLRSFPHFAAKWFDATDAARTFYKDLLELMRVAHGPTFFTARTDGRLVGVLVLTIPGVSLIRRAACSGLWARIVGHALLGRYGFSTRLLIHAWRRLRATPLSEAELMFQDDPHVLVLAVDGAFAGLGIGSTLLRRATAACTGRFSRIWLTVERENVAAIRFYERAGFHRMVTAETEHFMTLELLR
jgi:ribosomal protein S18 acetylase RimI-like enzyme